MRQKRICLSEYEVKQFVLDRRSTTCPSFGVGWKRGCDFVSRNPEGGECALCKRLTVFWRVIRKGG